MGLIYHAALENSLIMCFMDFRPWNMPLPVFFRLVDASKMKLRIFKNRLAEYLKRETEMLRPLLYCDAVSWCDDTKTIKPIINEAFVASSGDIITDYNDLYCAMRRVNITMSAFVIGETTNNKCYSTLLKTLVWFISGKFFE